MTGIIKSSIRGFENASALDLLARVAEKGLGGLLVPSVLDLSPTLAAEQLSKFRREADRLQLTIGAGVGWINPLRPERSAATLKIGNGDLGAGLSRLISAGCAIGIREFFFTIGMVEDRFLGRPSWGEQLAAVGALIKGLAPFLRTNKARLLVKTHEEITSFEICRLVEEAGPDILGVALDPVNVVVRLEDPVAATERVAAYVAQVHLDDADIIFEEMHLRRRLRTFGRGLIDWPRILALVPGAPRWIEGHRGQFTISAFDPDWLAYQPDLTPVEFASVVAMAVKAAQTTSADEPADLFDRIAPLVELYGREQRSASTHNRITR
jgi:sugar phosphate isomerase/epimerase